MTADESGFNSRGLNDERADKLKNLLNTIFVKNKGGLDESFTQKAVRFRDIDVENAEHVEFNCFWPTYDSMTQEQKDWYFHWRGRVREGVYITTDISYIFIHLYELINNVESASPTETLRMMCLLWQNYRHVYRRLDKYLVPWIEDFMIINMSTARPAGGSVYELQEITALADLLQSVTDDRLINLFPDYAIGRYLNNNLSGMPVELLSQFSDYEFYAGDFFINDKDDLLLKFLPDVVGRTDEYLRGRTGAGIFEKYKPEVSQRRHKIPFANAVYDGGIKSIEIPAIPYIKYQPLRDFITAVIRYAENCLREKTSYKGRLQKINLDEGVAEAIRTFIGYEYGRLIKRGEPTVISVDREKILQLIMDSNAVRMMLLENLPENADPAVEPAAEPAAEAVGVSDPAPETQYFNDVQKKILKFIIGNGGAASESEIAGEFKDIFIQVEIDNINEIAMDIFKDVLLLDENGKWIVIDDYTADLNLD